MSNFLSVTTKILIAGLTVLWAVHAGAQAYPNKPIRFIVPYSPGGSTSNVARLIGQKLTEAWGQQVIVDNRPGGNTVIGSEALAKSPPDGYTISLAASTHVTIPHLFSNLPYDPIKDFTPVATMVNTQLVLVLHPSVPANNLQEFIALAKSKPGQLNFASIGTGSSTHLAGELFNNVAGVRMQQVPYKGTAPALTDLIGGQVQLNFDVPNTSIPHIRSGKLKAIAVTGKTRLAALPQVPTFAEAGLPDYDFQLWMGVLAPAGVPKEIIDKLSTEIAKILAMPDMKERLISLGFDPLISTPDQFAALIKSDMTKFGQIIKTANIKLE